MKLGIDIGRVLIAAEREGGGDTAFLGGTLEQALETPPYDGMFAAVPELARRFGHQVWLVSKCGPKVQDKSRRWLDHHRFFERTGIPRQNLRFCLERPQKALHCRELGLTHFIDDRADVLAHLDGVVPHRYLFGPQRSPAVAPGLVPLPRWVDALALVGVD